MQKPISKKITVTSLSVAAVLIATIVCGVLMNASVTRSLNYGETFTGYISESSYYSREYAAMAFVEEQLSGAVATPSYESHTVIGTLSDSDIDKINESRDGSLRDYAPPVVSGETCEISYSVEGEARSIKADMLYTDGGEYLYGVRMPEKGEQPTKAYMDSVLDGEKYLNCTCSSRIGVTVLGIYNTYVQTIKFADDCAYFNQQLPGSVNELYLREYDGGVTAFLKNPMGDGDDNFYSVSELDSILAAKGYKLSTLYLKKGADQVAVSDLKSLNDVTTFALMMPIDCSYFIKTDTGFSMPGDKYKEVCKAVAGKDFADEFDKFWHDYRVNFRADYYVSEGRLAKIVLVLQMAYENDLISLSITSDYSNFDSTKVTVPHD